MQHAYYIAHTGLFFLVFGSIDVCSCPSDTMAELPEGDITLSSSVAAAAAAEAKDETSVKGQYQTLFVHGTVCYVLTKDLSVYLLLLLL